jgi:hypothetical protein
MGGGARGGAEKKKKRRSSCQVMETRVRISLISQIRFLDWLVV